MNKRLDVANRIYGLILRVYPRAYLEVFGEEMRQTFEEGASEARSQGTLGAFVVLELFDTPRVIAGAYWQGWRTKLQNGLQILQEVTSPRDLPPPPPDGRDVWVQAIFETAMFLVSGLLLILATYLLWDGLNLGWQHNLELLGKIIVPFSLALFLIGLLRGLPRWAYPFGGLFLGYQLLMTHQTSVWLFLIAMLLASTILALAAILTDPQPSLLPVPVRRIRQSLTADCTRLSFAMYGAMPCVIILAFDDSHFNNGTPYLIFSVVAMAITALIYCRSRVQTVQITTLLAGLTLCLCGAVLDHISFAYHFRNLIIVSSQGGAGNIWLIKLWADWIVLLLLPTLLILLGRILKLKQAV